MSSSKSSKSSSKEDGGKKGSTKKTKKFKQGQFDTKFMLSSMNNSHQGKRVLIKAKNIYTGKIPEGEEKILFQYSIVEVNDDLKTAVITFDDRMVEKGGDRFVNYQDTSGDDKKIQDYPLVSFKADHERYNKYIGIQNRAANEKKWEDKRKAEEEKTLAQDDTADLERLHKQGVSPYDMMVAEFEAVGDLLSHVTTSGKHAGQVHKKQEMKHKHSSHKFVWHHKLNKEEFDTSTIWKQVDPIVKKGVPGFLRIRLIYELQKIRTGRSLNSDDAAYAREVDMVFRVYAVLAAVGSKQPLSIFDNVFMRSYINKLNPRHRPPYWLERNRIVECMIDYVMMELGKIMKDRRSELGDGFVSGCIDFWTDPHRRQCFGAFVIDMLAEKYDIMIGNRTNQLFMSRDTKERLNKTTETTEGLGTSILVTGNPVLANLEFILNFENFEKKKTCANVSDWMNETCKAAKIEASDFNQLTADGAANAIGSLVDYEALTRAERPNDVDFTVCMAHQNERSGGYASGTMKFALDPNPELGAVLIKNHEIQVTLS